MWFRYRGKCEALALAIPAHHPTGTESCENPEGLLLIIIGLLFAKSFCLFFSRTVDKLMNYDSLFCIWKLENLILSLIYR